MFYFTGRIDVHLAQTTQHSSRVLFNGSQHRDDLSSAPNRVGTSVSVAGRSGRGPLGRWRGRRRGRLGDPVLEKLSVRWAAEPPPGLRVGGAGRAGYDTPSRSVLPASGHCAALDPPDSGGRAACSPARPPSLASDSCQVRLPSRFK